MKHIVVAAIVGILVLFGAGGIPLASVGGSLTIGFAFLAASLAVAIHEAWTERRGVLGWIVNVVIVLVAAFFAAQAGGFLMVMLLSPFMDGSSIAATGGVVMAIALAGAMGTTLLGAWGALRLLKRWR